MLCTPAKPSIAGWIKVLNSSISLCLRNAPLILPPPSSRSVLTPSSEAISSIARGRSSLGSGEDIRGAVLTQFREVGIGHFLAQNGDHMVAADIVLAIMNAARCIDADRKLAPATSGDMRFARNFGGVCMSPFRSLRHLAHRPAADDPPVGSELVMDTFIMSAQDISRDALCSRGEAARM